MTRSMAAAALLAVLFTTPALAGNISGSLPETGAKAEANGPDFKITNGAQGGGNKTPIAIQGVVTGADGHALQGTAQGADSVAVYGVNSATGQGGVFELTGAHTGPTDSALTAISSAGGNNESDQFGVAAIFKITNNNNQSSAVTISSTAGDGLDVTTKGGEAIAIAAQGGNTAVYGNSIVNGSTGVYGFGEAIGVYGHGEDGVGVMGDANGSGLAAKFTKSGAYCEYGGGTSWSCGFGTGMLDDVKPLDGRAALNRVIDMPLHEFRLTGYRDPNARWIGPTPADFNAAFPLGQDAASIGEGNVLGAALAAIQGLYAELQDRDAKIAALEARLTRLEGVAARGGDRAIGQQAAR